MRFRVRAVSSSAVAEAGKAYLAKQGLTADVLKNATHICWATGGRLVPDEVWKEYLVKTIK